MTPGFSFEFVPVKKVVHQREFEIEGSDIYIGKEVNLQISCSYFLKMKYPHLKWFHVPNERKTDIKISRKTGRSYSPEGIKLAAMGVSPGVPDILIPIPKQGFTGLAIELKVKPNTTTDHQLEWLDTLRSFGWKCHVIYGISAFEKTVSEYLK